MPNLRASVQKHISKHGACKTGRLCASDSKDLKKLEDKKKQSSSSGGKK